MDDTSTKLLKLAEELNANNINDIKSKLIKLAHNLMKTGNKSPLGLHEIDKYLNEIDEKENNTTNDKEQKDELFKFIDNALEQAQYHPKMPPSYSSQGNLTKTVWIKLFKKQTTLNHRRKEAPFYLNCDFNTTHLQQIFDDIPSKMKYDKGHIRMEDPANDESLSNEFKQWFIYKYKPKHIHIQKLRDEILLEWKKYGIWSKFQKMIKCADLEELVCFYEKYKEYIDINDIDGSGDTLLHELALEKDSGAVMSWMLSIRGIQSDIQNYDGEIALDNAKLCGYWNIVEMLTFASMGDKMRQKSDDKVAKLNRMKGIINQWFRFYKVENKNSNEYKSMQKKK
eukprot:233918_1